MTKNNTSTGSPFRYVRRTERQAWRDLLSVYYANTTVWRYLKSGALLWFGLMIWAFSNLVLSYVPEWTFVYYVMAYGFVLILWGPLTHFVVVPLVIRLRRTGESSIARTIARHGSKLNLTVFLAVVIVAGTLPFGPMVLDFQPAPAGDDGDAAAPVSADLECAVVDELVQCELAEYDGVDRVVVSSDGEEVASAGEPPFAFELDPDEHDGFVVEVRDENGETADRFVERVDALPEE